MSSMKKRKIWTATKAPTEKQILNYLRNNGATDRFQIAIDLRVGAIQALSVLRQLHDKQLVFEVLDTWGILDNAV